MIHEVLVTRMQVTRGGHSASEGVVALPPRAHDSARRTLTDAVPAWLICQLPENLHDALLPSSNKILHLGLDDGDLRIESETILELPISMNRLFFLAIWRHPRPIRLFVLNTPELAGDI